MLVLSASVQKSSLSPLEVPEQDQDLQGVSAVSSLPGLQKWMLQENVEVVNCDPFGEVSAVDKTGTEAKCCAVD